MTILNLKDLSLENKKVLLRVDFNVPLKDDCEILDDSRITACLPTLKYILEQKGILILLSHLGRPKGEVKKNLSLKVCAKRLSEKLGIEVLMAPDCLGQKTDEMKKALKPGQILMLENVRFHSEETDKNRDLSFAKKIALECDLYVNDAFGCCHRADASIVDLPKLFKNKSAMGFLLEKEINYFDNYIFYPKKPFVAVIGGSKISTKIGILKSLVSKVDALLIGGAMAYTFLKSQKFDLGNSLVEDSYLEIAKNILEKCQKESVPIVLPVDIVFAENLKEKAKSKVFNLGEIIPENWEGVDIGPKTVKLFESHLNKAKTIFWNGPLGVFEIKDFSKGTYEIAQTLSKTEAITIVGGGDSAAAIKQMNLESKFDHISTGGGASLELIEKGRLPGLKALKLKDSNSLS